MNSAAGLVGMTRVNNWTDAGDDQPPCRAKDDEQADCVEDEFDSSIHCTTHPFYFDFPARNVANGLGEGTSDEWKTT